MAGYECYACGPERPVVVITTSLVTGDTIASCQEDLVTALIGALSAELGVDAGKLFEALDRFVKRQAAEQAKAAERDRRAAAGDDQAQDAQHEQDHGQPIHGTEDASVSGAGITVIPLEVGQ